MKITAVGEDIIEGHLNMTFKNTVKAMRYVK